MLQTDSGASVPVAMREPAGSAMADYGLIQRAIEFLHERWREQPDLGALASHLGRSPTQLQKLFKRWCGLSPKEFLQAITIDHARDLLAGSASLLDASLEVGLSGPGRLHDLFVDHEAMTPGAFKRRGAGIRIDYGFHPSPFGLALIMATERGIAGLGFCDDDGEEARATTLGDMTRRWPAAEFQAASEVTGPLAARVFEPARWRRHDPLRVVLIGTDFEVRVWQSLLRVPAGRAVSYGDLAQSVCSPAAARAVGSAVGRNPISFVVPCHRVLRKDGGIGGYHWGVTRKQAIIGWERGRLYG